MAPSTVHLPNGQNLTVTPVFGGLFFKTNLFTTSHSPFPPGWSIVLNSEEHVHPAEVAVHEGDSSSTGEDSTPSTPRKRLVRRFKQPTLRNDHLYISSISNPSSSDYKPASSPSRQMAMMLWATLWWYFQQPEPDLRLTNESSKSTPAAGRPEGEWKITINREGIFKGKVVLPKLERMGLIASEESSVGANLVEGSPEGWTNMFVSRRSFWQLDPRLYLFTLSPMSQSPFPAITPYGSRPGSPVVDLIDRDPQKDLEQMSQGLWSPSTLGPFHSSSHLPTYYPPPPPQYKISNGIRHPLRPKPPRQGETFYTRFIPSLGQYLSFRVASISDRPVRHRGPVSLQTALPSPAHPQPLSYTSSDAQVPTLSTLNLGLSDTEYLHKWMNDPRVNHFWNEAGPQSHQEAFLLQALESKNSFPAIGCWDGKPFGYFELYWVKEDKLGMYVPHVGDYDRGFHCLVGEQEFRGEHRVRVWLSALVHAFWLADNRTETVMLEPRVDNEKLAQYCLDVGFFRERTISMPHKQSNLLKISRDAWEGPAL